MAVMVLFENAAEMPLLLYFAVKVCDPGARPVIKVVALACISPVPTPLPPCSRMTALASSVPVTIATLSTWKLIQPSLEVAGSMVLVTVTSALVVEAVDVMVADGPVVAKFV